jgi:hypothetical protein
MALNSNFRTLTADNIEGIVEDRNYLKSSFENGTITGWTEVSVALTSGLPTGTPTISSTAASSLALSATSVTPLSGSRSLLVDVPSALTAGHGFISDEFTLDRMDLGKVLTVSFDYERVTGTYNFSGTLGSQTWMVYVYDATLGAANWIQPAGFLGMNQSSGPGRVRATFQSSVTAGQKYRVAVIASQAAASASSIEFDNFSCSRQTAPIGPVVTDWVDRGAITITGSTSNPTKGATSVDKIRTRQVGDNLEVRIEYVQSAAGTAGSGDYLISLPSGFSIDTNKVTADSAIEGGAGSFTQNNSVGLATIQNVNSAAVGSVFVHDATRLRIGLINSEATGNTNSVGVWASNYYALTTGDFALQATFSVPLAGASSNVQLSSDTDTRVVAAGFYTTANKAVSSGAAFSFDAISYDTHSAVTLSQGRFTAPVSGIYQAIVNSASRTVSGGNTVKLYKNGAVYTDYFAFQSGLTRHCGSASLFLNAGEYIDFRIDGAITLESGFNVTVNRLSGPSVVAASETVAEIRQNTAGSIIGNTATKIPYPTTIRSTHNSWDSVNSRFIAPVSGTYFVSFLYSHIAAGLARPFEMYFTKSGVSNVAYFANRTSTAASTDPAYENRNAGCINSLVYLNAGEFIEFLAVSPNGAVTLFNNASTNLISIVRVGQ